MIIHDIISLHFGVLRRVCFPMCIYTWNCKKRPYEAIRRQIWRVRYLYTARPCLYHGLFAVLCYAIDRRRRPALHGWRFKSKKTDYKSLCADLMIFEILLKILLLRFLGRLENRHIFLTIFTEDLRNTTTYARARGKFFKIF
jgi:hypothetical protein